MPAPANLIHETSTTTGTGNLTVAAVNGKVRFSDSTYGFGTGGSDVFWYFISNQGAAEWEIGTGSMSDANTLVRDTIIFSSNSNNAVSFSAGTKDVTNDTPAAFQLRTEGGQTLTGTITLPNTGLHLLDTNASHDLIITPGSDLSADRTLTLTTGDANRTLTIGADSSISGTAYVSGGTDVAVADGGTGRSSHTAYAVLCGGTTSTAAQQSIASVGTSGQVLTSNGAAALPTFQDAAGGSGITPATVQATTSGTEKDFTSIPAGVNRITVILDEVSTINSNDIRIRIGDSGGIEDTGYFSTSRNIVAGTTTTDTTGFLIFTSGSESRGHVLLTRITSNTWIASHTASAANAVVVGTGSKTLSAELDRVRIMTSDGEEFAGGQVNIFYE